MAFAYNTSFHRTIKTSPYELTFVIEPRITNFATPDIRKNYGEDHGTELYQQMKIAHNTSRDMAAKNMEEAQDRKAFPR